MNLSLTEVLRNSDLILQLKRVCEEQNKVFSFADLGNVNANMTVEDFINTSNAHRNIQEVPQKIHLPPNIERILISTILSQGDFSVIAEIRSYIQKITGKDISIAQLGKYDHMSVKEVIKNFF